MTYYQSMGEQESDFVVSGGIGTVLSRRGSLCRPTNFSALAAFKNLQTQLNRVAAAKGWSNVTVDGDIGPTTMTLFNRAIPVMNQTLGYRHTADWNCYDLAMQATNFGVALKLTADRLGKPPAKPVAKNGDYVLPPTGPPAGPPSDMMAGLTSPLGLGAMALGGFLLVREGGKPKRAQRGKRRSSRKRRRGGRR